MTIYEKQSFEQALCRYNLQNRRKRIRILQVNMGKRCNQGCQHCHVESGPKRSENMKKATVDRLLELLSRERKIHTVDITGGAPELNPYFRNLVTVIRGMGKEVIDRCNLTVLFEKGQEDTAEFLAGKQVRIVASMPCYLKDNVDRQRGSGVFEKSIAALKMLNSLGYGRKGSGLMLNLAYNPVEAHLPPEQTALEMDYKMHLKTEYGVEFNQLFTITNMPITRYARMLERDGKINAYMQLLMDNFNPRAAAGKMCNELLSVSWEGRLYDCDFNQVLDIPLNRQPCTLWDIERFDDIESGIAVGDHCFGCTAGAGSSCSGALI
ncbi:MAG: arsenosugar biosynthesis radical SAM protein ArsS [Desulfobacterales bacterium]|nr:arsenosugar biosynthesis radical SAM protein ArsS [Desulfobacterales bacterium]